MLGEAHHGVSCGAHVCVVLCCQHFYIWVCIRFLYGALCSLSYCISDST